MGHDVRDNYLSVYNTLRVIRCAGWPGPPPASSWKTQLSLSWGSAREFDEVVKAVVKVRQRVLCHCRVVICVWVLRLNMRGFL
jgi:hypothetical protein